MERSAVSDWLVTRVNGVLLGLKKKFNVWRLIQEIRKLFCSRCNASGTCLV